MKESLEKATQGLIFALNDLREVRKKAEATNVEHLALGITIWRLNNILLDLEKFELARNTGGK